MASTSSLNLRKRLTGRETSEVFDLRCWTDIFPPSNWCRSSFNLSSSPVSAQCSLRKTTYSLHLMNTFKYGNSRAAIRIACPLRKTVYSPRYNAADILADKEWVKCSTLFDQVPQCHRKSRAMGAKMAYHLTPPNMD